MNSYINNSMGFNYFNSANKPVANLQVDVNASILAKRLGSFTP